MRFWGFTDGKQDTIKGGVEAAFEDIYSKTIGFKPYQQLVPAVSVIQDPIGSVWWREQSYCCKLECYIVFECTRTNPIYMVGIEGGYQGYYYYEKNKPFEELVHAPTMGGPKDPLAEKGNNYAYAFSTDTIPYSMPEDT